MAPAALSACVVKAPGLVECGPGAAITLAWTLVNDGSEPWQAGCTLRLVDGTGSLGATVMEVPELPAYGQVELGFDMEVPAVPGSEYAQHLALVSVGEEVFGEVLKASLKVGHRPKLNLSVRNDGPNPRPHPHLGVYPGSYTRQVYQRYKPGEAAPKASWRSPEVLREPPEVSEGWQVVEAFEAVPEPVLSAFGRPESSELRFTVNGERHVVRGGQYPISTSLAEYLRYHKAMTGTKIGCGEGGCGACTVALRAFRSEDDGLGSPGGKTIVNACLRPLHSVDNLEITTIEHLGTPAAPHPIQSAIVRHGGSQCGMCTPGFVMSIYGHLMGGGGTPEDAEHCVQGNICRCTGYRPIYDAIKDVSSAQQEGAASACCSSAPPVAPLLLPRAQTFAATQGGQTWLNCFKLSDVFLGLREYSGRPHRLVVGNTAMGVAKYYPPHPNDDPQVFINIQHVQELLSVKEEGGALVVGAAVPLASLIDVLREQSKAVPQFKDIVEHLKLVAHPQVRNVGCWAGNVMLAKTHLDFPSDVCLLLTLLDATIRLADASGEMQKVDVPTFLHSQDLPRTGSDPQIIHSVVIPMPKSTSIIKTFKVMRRKMNAHAELNAGFMFDFTDTDGVTVANARIVIGNVASGPFLASETCKALKGQTLEADTIEGARALLLQEVADNMSEPSVPDPPFVVVDKTYRTKLTGNLLFKAALRARVQRLGLSAIAPEEQSAEEVFLRAPSRGKQTYKVDASTAPVGAPVEKYEGLDQACGTADYTADIAGSSALFGLPVLAGRIGTVSGIDASACMQIPGFRQVITAKDVADIGANLKIQGLPYKIFASADEPTQYVGQFVALVVGESLEAARLAAKLVKVEYSSLEDSPVLSIEEAAASGNVRQHYDPAIVGEEPDHRAGAGLKTIQGTISSMGQRHFYMETQTTLASPSGSGGLVVNTSCQVFDWAHKMLANTLRMDAAKITVQNIRVGGAYGGKSDLYAPGCAAACVAALKMKKPVLVALDRTSDFLAFGGRPAFTATWTCTYDAAGKIRGLTQEGVSQTGADVHGMTECTGLNCYSIASAKLHSRPAVTNTAVCTIMRAPGNFEGAFVMEAIIEQVARSEGVDPMVVQQANLNPYLGRVYDALKRQVDYDGTRAAVAAFNAASRYQKRGLYCMGSLYGMTPTQWVERCSASVHSDGSVALMHSGIEQGQGLDTKAVQACARVFEELAPDFRMDRIKVVEPKSTTFFSWAGVTPSWGSATSETVAAAVGDACGKIAAQLRPHVQAGRSWTSIVAAAAAAGAALTQPGEHSSGAGNDYAVACAGCAKVQVDVLTGETQVLSYDLVYDCGRSLNPAVDIGQMEGSLVQAIGYSLSEQEYRSTADGRMINCGTWDYKVPTGLDIPIDMNVTLLEPTPDDRAGYLGGKASGEPAQLCGLAVFYAVKDAIGAARKDAGLPGSYFSLDPPASPERVLLACSS